MSSAFFFCENRWRDLKWRCPHILCHRRCYWMSQSSKEVRILVIKFTSKLLEIMVQVCITSCYSIPLSTMVFCLSFSLGIKFTVGMEFYKGSYICKSHDRKRFHFNAKNIHWLDIYYLYSPNLNFAWTLFSLLEMTYYSNYWPFTILFELSFHWVSLSFERTFILEGH